MTRQAMSIGIIFSITHISNFFPLSPGLLKVTFGLVTFQSDCNNLFCGVWSSQKKNPKTDTVFVLKENKNFCGYITPGFRKIVLFSCSYSMSP